MKKIAVVLVLSLSGIVGCASKPDEAVLVQQAPGDQEVIVVLPNCQELAGQLICQWITPPDRMPIEEAAAQEHPSAPESI